jgi:hypothetical protein
MAASTVGKALGKLSQNFLDYLSKNRSAATELGAGGLENLPDVPHVSQLPRFKRAMQEMREVAEDEGGSMAYEYTDSEIFSGNGMDEEIKQYLRGELDVDDLEYVPAELIGDLTDMGMDKSLMKEYLDILVPNDYIEF